MDFNKSSYIKHAPKAGLDFRLLEKSKRNQQAYIWPLFEYKFEVNPTDMIGDFDQQNATTQEIERALKSPSARVRLRAIMTLCTRENITVKTILLIASLQADNGEYDYEFGKVYGPGTSRFCPSVSFCAQFSLPVLAHRSPTATLELIITIAQYSEEEQKRVLNILSYIGLGAVAASLAICKPISVDNLKAAQQVLTGRLPDIATLIAAYMESDSQKEVRIVAYLASKSIIELNDFIRTLIQHNSGLYSWIGEGILHQKEKVLCEQLAEHVDSYASTYLIRGLGSYNKKIRLACGYTISQRFKNSKELQDALEKAIMNENSILTRWSLRRYLTKMKGVGNTIAKKL